MELLLNSRRNLMLDALKALAIFLVVLTHIFQRTIPNYGSTDCWWAQIIYLLCVPIFFFLSGISYSKKKELSPLGFIYDILKRGFLYFWPFLFFILLRMGIYNQWNNVSDAFDELMKYPVSGLWVCWILVFITIVLDIGLLISKLYPKLKKLFVSIMFVIGIVILLILRDKNIIDNDSFIGYNYFIIYTPLFLVGYLIGDNYFKIKKPIISIIISIISLTGLIVLCYYKRKFMSVHFYDDVWYNYLACLLSLGIYLGVVEIFKKLQKTQKILGICGKYTLEIYFVHLIILKAFSRLFYFNTVITILVIIGLLLLCYVSTAAIILLTYYVPFLHFALFGKHFSRYDWEDKFWDIPKKLVYKLVDEK
ncbi:MAG: acyltransferase [Bacilli bacterium]|nr:acyltransferase [Bacilli bacterium]